MEEYGYFEDKGVLVTRAGTDRLYLLDFHKIDSIEKINEEFGDINYSGLYLLIDSTKNKIYVGESSNVKMRNKGEIKTPPVQGFEFNRIILIWDGRPSTTSCFGEEGFRKSLEKVCINVFNNDYSDYENINTVKNPKETNIRTKSSVTRFTNDLYFLLKKYGLIHRIPE